MYCPYCNMHDQRIGGQCTRCHRTVTASRVSDDDDSSSPLNLFGTMAAVELAATLFETPSDPGPSYDPPADTFSGFGGGETGGGGAGGDF